MKITLAAVTVKAGLLSGIKYVATLAKYTGPLTLAIRGVIYMADKEVSNDDKKMYAAHQLKRFIDDKTMTDQQVDELVESVYRGLLFLGWIRK